MSTSTEIRRAIETLMIEHTAFASALGPLQRRIQDTFDGFLPCLETLIGPSRCGKTELVRLIAREYPESRQNGRRQVPVLVVYISSGTAPKDLPNAVIMALGLPKHTGSVSTINKHMYLQLELAGVRVIIFDEASHLVDVGAKMPPRAASDWFKDLQANTKDIGILLTGVPRLKRLLESNEQLRNRARKPIMLMPYRWDDAEQRKAFAGCVSAFLHEFQERGCGLDMPFNNFVRQCYAASAGHVGLLAKFFQEVASDLEGVTALTFDHCAHAVANLNLPGNGAIRPFSIETLDDIALMQVLASELDRYDLVLPPLTAHGELAQAKVNAMKMRAA